MLAIQSNGDRIFGKRNSLSSDKYLKSFVTNHGTWPHYFILMSCHTWQKYDMNNKNKEDLCWEADQLPPLVPSKKTYFMGYTVRSTMGKKKNKKIKFKEVVVSQTGIKWWDIHKTSSFIRVLSLSLVDEMEPPRILFCLQWKGKGEKRNKKQETEKKRHFQHRQMYFQSLSWSQIKIPQVLWNMLPHEPSFVLLYSVCSYATLITKS